MSYTDITRRILEASLRAGRSPGSVHLIAVSKVQPDARVRDVLEPGIACSARITFKRRRRNGPPSAPNLARSRCI